MYLNRLFLFNFDYDKNITHIHTHTCTSIHTEKPVSNEIALIIRTLKSTRQKYAVATNPTNNDQIVIMVRFFTLFITCYMFHNGNTELSRDWCGSARCHCDVLNGYVGKNTNQLRLEIEKRGNGVN